MSDKNTKPLSRRDFFQRAAVLGAAAALMPPVLLACDPNREASPRAPKTSAGEFTCTDESGLTEQEKSVRAVQEYVDRTPRNDQDCANCGLYTEAPAGQCGGCTVVPGPIHPDGWCKIWVPIPS